MIEKAIYTTRLVRRTDEPANQKNSERIAYAKTSEDTSLAH